ncbi:ATP-dependent exoDNAse (exonuclease V) alpha subunit [Azospirillum agricola]|nr:ATP-dependent exoDNAse (exonuclease V) alpha subunit [Azospirillum agricola]
MCWHDGIGGDPTADHTLLKAHILDKNDTDNLALAFAITCHKAQGSSVGTVVIPVYDSRIRRLARCAC